MKPHPFLLFFALAISFFQLSLDCKAQEIIGLVLDKSSREPIPGVSIVNYEEGIGTVSDADGSFKMSMEDFPLEITFSHIAYRKEKLSFPGPKKYKAALQDGRLVIELKPEKLSIGEAVVTSGPRKLLAENPYFIQDYLFANDRILMLANRNNNILRSELLLCDLDGNMIRSFPFNKAKSLHRDCFGNIHVVGKDSSYQLYYKRGEFLFPYVEAYSLFERAILPARIYKQGKMVFEVKHMNNRFVQYYLFSEEDSTWFFALGDLGMERNVTGLNKLEKKLSVNMIQATAESPTNVSILSSAASKEIDVRFNKQANNPKVEAEVLEYSNQIIVADIANRKLNFFNWKGEYTKGLDFQDARFEKQKFELLQDELTEEIYLYSNEKSLYHLDLSSGALNSVYDLSDYSWLDHVKVYDNKLYFLSQNKTGLTEKKLYKIRI